MAIAYGASLGTPVTVTNVEATTIALTTNVSVPSGGFLTVEVTWYNNVTCSLSGGGLTWTKDAQADGTADTNHHIARFSAQAPAGLASGTTLTATFSGAGAFGRGISGDYWTGIATSSPTDGTSTNAPGNPLVSSWTSGSISTTNADDLVLSSAWFDIINTSNTPSAPAIEIRDFTMSPDAGTIATEYRIVSATGSYNLGGTWAGTTGTAGAEWLVVQVAYKASGGGGGGGVSVKNLAALGVG